MAAMNTHVSDQIEPKQLTSLIIMTIFPTLILMSPSLLLRVNQKDAIWVLVLAILSGVLIARISVAIYHKFHAQRQTQTFFLAFGRWIGGVFCLLYLLVVLAMLVIVFREFAELSSWAFAYGDVPAEVFLVMGGILAFVMSVSGIEAIARICQLLLPVSILFILIILIAAAPWMNWRFLWPPIPKIEQKLFFMAAHPAAFFSEGFLMAMYFPQVRATLSQMSRAMVSGMVWTGSICIIVMIGLIAFFGGELGGNFTMPLLHLSKGIRFGTFISHLQVLMVPFLVSAISIKMAIVLHAISLGCQDFFKLQGYRLVAFILTMLSIIAASLVFDNPLDLIYYLTNYGTFVLFPTFVALNLLPCFFMAIFRRSGNRRA